MEYINFNKPVKIGNELQYMEEAISAGHISGDGSFTRRCHSFIEKEFGFAKVLLTTSCTSAIEMAALLTDIKPGDEVIVPSYTFVSTANPFVLRGAKIVFADSCSDHPNMDVSAIEELITERTKVIVPVHYAGMACDLETLMTQAKKHNIYVVEDAAQSFASLYQGAPLGTLGDLAAFSFHETKVLTCGEGGMLAINAARFFERAEIIREKGTNRSAFFRGEIAKYGWVDLGSSYLPTDMCAAYLLAQLENCHKIIGRRLEIWNAYYDGFRGLHSDGLITLPIVPKGVVHNGSIFYFVCQSPEHRTRLIKDLRAANIHAVFHYLPLHNSPFYQDRHDGRVLPNADRFASQLLRLPLYYELTDEQVAYIVATVNEQVVSYA